MAHSELNDSLKKFNDRLKAVILARRGKITGVRIDTRRIGIPKGIDGSRPVTLEVSNAWPDRFTDEEQYMFRVTQGRWRFVPFVVKEVHWQISEGEIANGALTVE